MRVLAANIEEVFREAAARWTLLAYFFLSTLFIVTFALAVNLDIVNGALAGAKLFGNQVQLGGNTFSMEQVVLGFEAIFSAVLYLVGTFLSIFATAHLVPRMQEKGTIDLYLSRPIGRVRLLLSRYTAGLVLAGLNVFYLVGAIWLVIIWKTGVVNPRFLAGGLIIFFAIATLLAFAFLVGVVTSSTAVSIMATFGLFFFSAILAGHERFEAAFSAPWKAWVVRTLYWILPKTYDLGRSVIPMVSRGQMASAVGPVTASPFITTGLFGIGCLVLASFLFTRKEF